MILPCRVRPVVLAAVWLGVTALAAPTARAACNAVPAQPDTFRGAVGALDRPFAGAGDRVVARPACGSPLLSDVDGDGAVGASDVMVTLVFEPPEGGSRHVVVLTGAKECPVTDACAPTPVSCIKAAPGLAASDSEVAFDLPDTSGLFPGVEAWDLTGSARVAVTASNAPAPCGLVRGDCTQASPPGAFACVDALFDPEPGHCGTGRADVATPFVHFTALPRANDYRALCDDDAGEKPACADAAADLRFTVDALGNLAVPMSWRTILRDRSGTPQKDNRAVRGSTAVPARSSGTAPMDVPSAAFLASFTPRGTRFPTDPPFAPERGAPGRSHELVLAGEADQPASVLWLWRRRAWDHACDSGPRAGQACEPATAGGDCGGPYRCVQAASPVFYTCRGGARAGLPCTRQSQCGPGTTSCEAGAVCVARGSGVPTGSACKTDLDCAAQEECGTGLFEFRDRLAGGAGPVVVPKDVPPGKEGVCRGGGKDGDRCSAACGPDRCVLFRTEAKGYKPRP